MIVIVDYGMGNVGSIFNMLKKVGAEAGISSSLSEIEKADKIVLPGVGAFDNAMKSLGDRGMIPVLNAKVLEEKVPVLGICLGIQLFSKRSEEGVLPGLGWIDAETFRFDFGENRDKLKIPHMGWNTVDVVRPGSIFGDMYEDPRFYFVHSYHVVCRNAEDVLSTTRHGIDFTSAVQRGNIVGTQFHPEKSHKFGMRVLECFAGMEQDA